MITVIPGHATAILWVIIRAARDIQKTQEFEALFNQLTTLYQ